MLCMRTKSYVFPSSIRRFYYLSLFSVIGFAAFSLLMWYVICTQGADQIPLAIVAVLFTNITFLLAILGIRNAKRMDMQYRIVNGVAENLLGDLSISVAIESAVFAQIVLIPFYVGKGKIEQSFYLLSNDTNPSNLLDKTENPLKKFNLLWDAHVVVIPSDALRGGG